MDAVDGTQTSTTRGVANEVGPDVMYRLLYDGSSDGILLADRRSLAILQGNPAALRLFAQTETALVGMTVLELFPEASRPAGLTTLRALLRGEEAAEPDVACLRSDGSVVLADVTTSTLMLNGREALAAIFREVTSTKGAQRAMAASEVRYRRLFESAQDGILILDADSGQIVDVNPYLYDLMGYSREELLDQVLWEIGPFKNIVAARESFDDLRVRGYLRYEHLPLETRDGRSIDVEFVSNVYSVEGVEVIQCNIRDITVRKRNEAALRTLERAIQAVPQGILVTDSRLPGDPIVYVSPGFERLTGYSAAETLGRNCRFLQGVGTDPESVAEIRAAVLAGRACAVDLLNYRKDGGEFWNHLAISPVRDADGQLVNFVGIQTDVTERRQLEAQFLQAQKMEAVGRLAGGIAHDFNNVLSVILSYADIILGDLGAKDPLFADVLEVQKAGIRAMALTKQLLAFSRHEVLDGRVLDLQHSVVAMEKMLQRLLGADVVLTLLPTVGLWSVKADPGQIEQILMNLAVNARDAMPRGGELTIETTNVVLDADYARAHHGVQPGPHVMLAVSDTGMGMDQAVRARIFEPFFTTKAEGKGTGLGLATVFGIVKQSGGHIWVYSEPGKGTTFKLYFPRVNGAVDVVAVEAPVVEHARATGTILLVEDDEQLRILAASILRRAGYVVLVASNAGEGLLICEKHGAKVDLLLTDVVLPRMSGRQLADRLSPLRPEMRVLFMSGYTEDAVLQHGVLDSGVAYLQKPLSPASLLKKVREALTGPGERRVSVDGA